MSTTEQFNIESGEALPAAAGKEDLDRQLAAEGSMWQHLVEDVDHGFISPEDAEAEYIRWRQRLQQVGEGLLQAS
jgi:hypothetical protein